MPEGTDTGSITRREDENSLRVPEPVRIYKRPVRRKRKKQQVIIILLMVALSISLLVLLSS